jgi:hypothetical protein
MPNPAITKSYLGGVLGLFPLFFNRHIAKNRSTGISNGSFFLTWVESGAFSSRSPVSKTSSCGDDPGRTQTLFRPNHAA